MNPKFFEYMDEEQKRLFEEQQRRQGGINRLLGLVKDKIGGPLKWIAWRLWGRRQAIKRMRELALGGGNYWARPTPEKEEDRIASHREHLDSLRVPLPTPDSHDVN